MCLCVELGQFGGNLEPSGGDTDIGQFLSQKGLGYKLHEKSWDLGLLGGGLEGLGVVLGEKLQFLTLNNIQQQMPIKFSQNRMPFYAQEEGAGAFTFLTDKPLVNSIQFWEEFKGELCYFLVFADETGFDSIEHRFSIFRIMLVEVFQLGYVFGQ